MAAICASSILACGMRITLLDDNGNVADQANNYYVTDNLIDVQMTPEIEQGADRTLKSGCSCIIATAKFPDLLKRFNFQVRVGQLEPGLLGLMLGATVITAGGFPIGIDWPDSGISCAATPPPKVALEVWSDVWEDDQQNETLPYWHWVWPMTRWTIGQTNLNEDFLQLPLTGYSLSNGLWGHGPYNDDPGTAIGALGSVWQTADVPPDGVCGLQTVTPSS